MQRRSFLKHTVALASASALAPWSFSALAQDAVKKAMSVNDLPPLEGELTLYLGRGEGGLYEKVVDAIKARNPKFKLRIKRGASAALANAIVAEGRAGINRADLFWAVDVGAIGLVTNERDTAQVQDSIKQQLQPTFVYDEWVPVTGRVRTLPFHTQRLSANDLPKHIADFADTDLKMGWAPAYASFQSFVTAMRLLDGEDKTARWLEAIHKKQSKSYAGELGVVMGAERGEIDVGFANHYYTLRLKSGKPNANVDLAFTQNDAGCLVNASGIVSLSQSELAQQFIHYLLTEEVQSFLALEASEIPLVHGVAPPKGLQDLATLNPPTLDLRKLADLRPTLKLLRRLDIL